MANQFLDHAETVLSKVQSPLTFNEIWEKGIELGFDKKIRTEGKTPWNSLGAQLFVDVRDNPDSRFIKVGKRPARFFLKSRQTEVKASDLNQIEIQAEKSKNLKHKNILNETSTLYLLFLSIVQSNLVEERLYSLKQFIMKYRANLAIANGYILTLLDFICHLTIGMMTSLNSIKCQKRIF